MAKHTRKSCFELRAALDALYIRQSMLAQICGVKPLQVWRWCEGRADVPQYVWTILGLAAGRTIWQIRAGDLPTWKVEHDHVYRNGKDYKALAKRFHPDASRVDTTTEMQLVNALRKK
jgi:hypothetical protein